MSGAPNRDSTPTLEEGIRGVIEKRLVDVHTTLPGKVVSYDPATQKATVQIQIKRTYWDGSVVAIPPLPAVPVVWPRGQAGQIHIHWKLLPGDDVVLHFAERSLDNWKTQGGLTENEDSRKFNLSDAFAVPGGSAFPDAFEVIDPDALEVAFGTTAIQLYEGGQVKVSGGNDDELIKILHDLVTLISQAQTATIFGPQLLVPTTDPTWELILMRIDAFKKG